MMVFMKPIFLFGMFFSPVQLEDYKLTKADFNMGDTVFEDDDLYLSQIDERTFQITSPEKGEQTFRMWDFLTMLGSFVEFDTWDSNPQVRCIFEDVAAARALFSSLKPSPQIENKYPLLTLVQIYENAQECEATNIYAKCMIGGALVDEFRNRFIIYSRTNVPVMIFSTGHFNVSPVLSLNRIFLVLQAYDIETENIVMLKFLVRFRTEELANAFHDYVTKESPCINSMIPINMPSYITR